MRDKSGNRAPELEPGGAYRGWAFAQFVIIDFRTEKWIIPYHWTAQGDGLVGSAEGLVGSVGRGASRLFWSVLDTKEPDPTPPVQ